MLLWRLILSVACLLDSAVVPNLKLRRQQMDLRRCTPTFLALQVNLKPYCKIKSCKLEDDLTDLNDKLWASNSCKNVDLRNYQTCLCQSLRLWKGWTAKLAPSRQEFSRVDGGMWIDYRVKVVMTDESETSTSEKSKSSPLSLKDNVQKSMGG